MQWAQAGTSPWNRSFPALGGVLPHNGKALLFAQHHLEEIARRLDFPPLEDVLQQRPDRGGGIPHSSRESQPTPTNLAAEEWFDAGRRAAERAAADRIAEPIRRSGMGQIERVRADLAAMEAILENGRSGRRAVSHCDGSAGFE